MKKILITEEQLHYILGSTSDRELLMEMPYSPKDFMGNTDVHARLVYELFDKILLFGDSTNNASDWTNQILNRHTIPILTSKVTGKPRVKTNLIIKGFKTNFFGDNFEDYEEQMSNFCAAAEIEVKEGAMRLYNSTITPIRTTKESVELGRNIIEGFCNKISELTNYTDFNEVYDILQPYVRNLPNTNLELNI